MTQASPTPAFAVQIDGLSKSFGHTAVLRGIDLQITAGEHVAICGPSGSGKSTLIRCIGQLESFEAGRIQLLGRDILAKASADSGVPPTGMVFQQFNLFPHLSVMRNCTLALERVLKVPRPQAQETAHDFLTQVHMQEHSHKYPSQLSGGQQQRVAIARALCMRPQILLFDEPTSALDPEMVAEVLEVMAQLTHSGITMLCVTHEMAFARAVADRVAFMDQGQLLEVSPAADFFRQPKHPRAQQFLKQPTQAALYAQAA